MWLLEPWEVLGFLAWTDAGSQGGPNHPKEFSAVHPAEYASAGRGGRGQALSVTSLREAAGPKRRPGGLMGTRDELQSNPIRV